MTNYSFIQPLSLGLTGYPLGHSLSPRMHNAALRQFNLQGEYRLYPVDPASEVSLAELIASIRSCELHGLNVTIPHKETIIPLLDTLTPIARAIGAVNTVFWNNDRLVGDNTDAPGFLNDLKRIAPALVQISDSNSKSAVVLGSGGGARAVAYALATSGWNLSIVYARPDDEQQANALADDIAQSSAHPMVLTPSDLAGISPDLLVNTTPLGMLPRLDATPWPENIPMPSSAVVYDLVYNPAETRFVASARMAGLVASTGLGMLASQAALSFERWTGLKPSVALMYQAAEDGLANPG